MRDDPATAIGVETLPDPSRVDCPPDLGEALRRATGRTDRPASLSAALAAVADLVVGDGGISVDRFFQSTPTRHEVRFDGRTEHVPCVLDALIVAVLVDADPVEVRSRPPTDVAPVRITLADGEVAVDPEGAVVTFGLAPDGDGGGGVTGDSAGDAASRTSDDADRRDAVESFDSMAPVDLCGYINAFPDGDAADRWVDGLSPGIVTVLSVDVAVALAREATATWGFDAGD